MDKHFTKIDSYIKLQSRKLEKVEDDSTYPEKENQEYKDRKEKEERQ